MDHIKRIQKLNDLKNHPWFDKYFLKLSTKELDFMISFLNENQSLTRDEIQFKINRILLDKTLKPKKLLIINELLTVANGK